jgi:hypothetical protein
VDDGLEWRHGDLGEARYMRAASHDWNGKDDDPSPANYDDTHGTCTLSILSFLFFLFFDIFVSPLRPGPQRAADWRSRE